MGISSCIEASPLLHFMLGSVLERLTSVSPELNLRREVASMAVSILNQRTKEYSPVLARVKEKEGSVVRERVLDEEKQLPPFDHTWPSSHIWSSALAAFGAGAVPPLSCQVESH